MANDTVKAVQENLKKFIPNDARLHAALLRIAMIVIARAKINIRRQKMIQTGTLLNSLRWSFYKEGTVQGVHIGSFGVIYAAMNEFGSDKLEERQVRAMFWALRRANRTGHVNYRSSIDPIVTHNTGVWSWRARPYLRPAFAKERKNIIDILRNLPNE